MQEAWLRLAHLDGTARDEIHELGAWLTTVVGRICLDRIRSAAARRERYVGPWLAEPVVSEPDSEVPGPLETAVQREDLRMAAMRVLHQLPPDQRLALVLHDAFDVPFADIAEMLDCSVPAVRQHASRGRRTVSNAGPPPRVPRAEHQRVLDEFLTAVSSGNVEAVVRVLHPQAVVYGDGGGKARTALRAVVGGEKVAQFTLGLVTKYGEDLLTGIRPVLVNGDPGVLLPGTDTGQVAPRVMTLSVRDGRVAELFDVANPDKLTRIRF